MESSKNISHRFRRKRRLIFVEKLLKMKLRTTHNSIRIRIRKSELVTLQEQRIVEESISFPNGIVFKFALSIDTILEDLTATLENNYLKLSIAEARAKTWITTNEVGIETNIDLENNEQLHLLIEKDFPCLDRENEDKSDTFWELASEKPEVC